MRPRQLGKSWENLEAAFALHLAHYNFCRVHKKPRRTPATESGLTGRIWTMRELLEASNTI